jgi:DNA-binding helix-hairpin-helix protein with protein kinase domain
MPLERAIRECRFAYGADAEARKMRQPPGTLALSSMPSLFVRLFRRAFLSTDRPRPREWIEHLDALARALKKCELHSGHYYYCELSDCPWCGIESQARIRLFNFLLPGEDSRRGHFRLDEIWKEIVSLEAPGASLIQWDKILESPAPSAVVSAFARVRDSRIGIALIFSIFAGLATGWLLDFPLGLFMLILAGLIACAITRVGTPLLESVQARHRRAKAAAQRLQEQYDLEPGNDQWNAKWDELSNRKETYENLAQIRRLKLQELEAEARKNRLEEFLDQFEINDAEIKGINPTVKTTLLSHGVETAADVSEIKKLKQIPSIGNLRARWLLGWRNDLEQKFVFDPAKGVPLEARLRTERDVDALRFRLESELSEGARHLRQMKREIETNMQRLQPALAQARLELAQADVDLAVASKRNPVALILTALIVALLIALAAKSPNLSPPTAGPVPAPAAMEKASSLYVKGELDLKEEKFEEAVVAFRGAVRIDPNFYDAYVKLGYALYRLQRYQESAEASEKAIRLRKGFEP